MLFRTRYSDTLEAIVSGSCPLAELRLHWCLAGLDLRRKNATVARSSLPRRWKLEHPFLAHIVIWHSSHLCEDSPFVVSNRI